MDSPCSSTSVSSCGSDCGDDDAAIFGEGAYYNLRRGIELREIGEDFHGLFLTVPVKAGTVLWKNRSDGPAEARYRKLYGDDIHRLSAEEMRYFIRYSYQNGDEFFISPLCEEEVQLDYSNYYNHSCRPNTLPTDEDTWVAIRDIDAGEHLTIDYATFDSNDFVCIERCLCAQPECREFVRGDDYRITELQQKYDGYFLSYIAKRINEERELIAAGGVVGGAGGPNNNFSAQSVRAFHAAHRLDVEAQNRRALAALVARFSNGRRPPTTNDRDLLDAATITAANACAKEILTADAAAEAVAVRAVALHA